MEQYRICGELLSHQYGLLKKDIRDYFFHQEPQIYSKAYDPPPAKYNAGSKVSNSLIASGCIINSTVEDSVLFKKVFVGNNSVIKNSIIMNGAYIGDNVYIENCIVESSGDPAEWQQVCR